MGCRVLGWGARVEDLLAPLWVRHRSSSREEASAAAMWDAMSMSDLRGRGGEMREGRAGEGGEDRRGKGGEGKE